jgi:predicted membrane protein
MTTTTTKEKTMDEYNLNNVPPRSKVNFTFLAAGIGMMILGILIALDQLASFSLPWLGVRAIALWPLVIVAVGMVKIVESRLRSVGGWVLFAIGILLFARSVWGRVSIGDIIWPCILVAVGVFIVFHAVQRHRRVPSRLNKSGDFARGTAILSAYTHKPNGGIFDGGEITAIFGGFEIDLRQATMKNEAAKIDIFVLFGGGEILVPDGWEVSVQVSAVAGGVNDRTLNLPTAAGKRPKLLVTGTVMLGGIEVK